MSTAENGRQPRIVMVGGKQYEVDVKYGRLRRLRDTYGINLLTNKGHAAYSEFITDDDTCWTVVCELCGLTTPEQQDELADKCTGADVAKFINAVAEGLIDFFRDRGWTETVTACQKMHDLVRRGRQKLAEKIEGTDLATKVLHQIEQLSLTDDPSPNPTTIPG